MWQYCLIALGDFFVGLSKGGLPGLGNLTVVFSGYGLAGDSFGWDFAPYFNFGRFDGGAGVPAACIVALYFEISGQHIAGCAVRILGV